MTVIYDLYEELIFLGFDTEKVRFYASINHEMPIIEVGGFIQCFYVSNQK